MGSMILYLVRHGRAKPSAPTGRDADRPLEAHGQRQAAWLGDLLAGDDAYPVPSLILASGILRADETARLIHERIGGELRFVSALEIGRPAEGVIDLLRAEIDTGRGGPIMLVGHNPQMEILVARLAPARGGDMEEMGAGMAAMIELDPEADLTRGGCLLDKLRHEG